MAEINKGNKSGESSGAPPVLSINVTDYVGVRGNDKHTWYPKPLSKREIGIAFGLDDSDRKIADKVNSLCESAGIVIKPKKGKHPKLWFMALDTLPPLYLELFRKHVRDY